MTILAEGLSGPETPRFHPTLGLLCVEMGGRPGVTRVLPDGRLDRVAPAGCPNGLVVRKDGTILVGDTRPPALLRISQDGAAETLMTEGDRGPFLLPNDFAFAPSGLLYMTDSGIPMEDWAVSGAPRPDWESARFDGKLWEIDLGARTARAVDSGLRFANGIAFGPEGDLYVNEMISGAIYRYAVRDGCVQVPRQIFTNVLSEGWPGGFRGPDGMLFSRDGRLWCTVYGEGCVAVIDREGRVTDRLRTEGRRPTNLVFRNDGSGQLLVTEHELGRIEVFEVGAEGLPVH